VLTIEKLNELGMKDLVHIVKGKLAPTPSPPEKPSKKEA